jgi:cytoskeletal protein CcmA (bactofilin family)
MKKDKKADLITTFVGTDASIDGNIEFKGTLRVDGNVKGRIASSDGTIIVGEKAVVNAEVFVGVAVIMGEVNGTIDARDRIEVFPPGRVGGDIQTPVLSIEPGGILNGSCVMKKQPDSNPKLSILSKNQSAVAESNKK